MAKLGKSLQRFPRLQVFPWLPPSFLFFAETEYLFHFPKISIWQISIKVHLNLYKTFSKSNLYSPKKILLFVRFLCCFCPYWKGHFFEMISGVQRVVHALLGKGLLGEAMILNPFYISEIFDWLDLLPFF